MSGTQQEETKITVNKADVAIDTTGKVTISDPRVISKLNAHAIVNGRALEDDGVSVGVVVGKSF